MRTFVKIIAIACIAITIGVTSVPRTFAATPSPSPKTSPSPTPKVSPSPSPDTTSATSSAVQQNIKDRIEQVIEEKKSTGDQRRKRAIVGQVEKLNAESITIRMLNGTTQNAKIMDGKTMMLLMPNNLKLETQDIELNAFVIAMGYLTEEDVLEVRRLLISPLPLFPIPRQVLVGKVKSITTKDITVVTRDDKEQKVLVSKNTAYADKDGDKAVRTDIAKDDEVFVSVTSPVTASSSASLVRMLK